MRAFERALRRAGLPLRMTEGYSPRPRISFPVALGVGTEGIDEVMEFDLAEWVPTGEVANRLARELPEGLELVSVELGSPKEHARAAWATYRVEAADGSPMDERMSASALTALMEREAIWVERQRKGRNKRVNIRPFIKKLGLDGNAMVLEVAAGPEGSARPEEILEALGFDATEVRGRFRLTRVHVVLQN